LKTFDDRFATHFSYIGVRRPPRIPEVLERIGGCGPDTDLTGMMSGKVTGQPLGIKFRTAQCRRIAMKAQHHMLHNCLLI
jgi:hypothetical protein